MALAIVIFSQWSNFFLVLLSVIILVFLLRAVQIRNRFWIASFIAAILVGLISISHMIAYNSLLEQLKNKEAALESMKATYEKLKSESVAARGNYDGSRTNVNSSRQELEVIKQRLNTEFDKTIREIRAVYAGISDEELDRRVNNAVRKARQNLQRNVFQ